MWSLGNPCTLAVGMYNLTAALENSLAVLQKLNIDSPYDPAIPLLGTDPRELKAMFKKNLHMNLYSSAVCKSGKEVTTQMSTNRWMDKLNVVGPQEGIKWSHMIQRGCTLTTLCWVKKAREKWFRIVWSVQNRTIDRDRKQISDCQWLGVKGLGKTVKEYGVFKKKRVWGLLSILELDASEGHTTLWVS